MTKQYDSAKIEQAIATAKLMMNESRALKKVALNRNDDFRAKYHDGRVQGVYDLLVEIQNCEVKGDE